MGLDSAATLYYVAFFIAYRAADYKPVRPGGDLIPVGRVATCDCTGPRRKVGLKCLKISRGTFLQ